MLSKSYISVTVQLGRSAASAWTTNGRYTENCPILCPHKGKIQVWNEKYYQNFIPNGKKLYLAYIF